MKITQRDVSFFILGFFTFFLIETIMDWEGTKESFEKGFKDDLGSATKVELKNNTNILIGLRN